MPEGELAGARDEVRGEDPEGGGGLREVRHPLRRHERRQLLWVVHLRGGIEPTPLVHAVRLAPRGGDSIRKAQLTSVPMLTVPHCVGINRTQLHEPRPESMQIPRGEGFGPTA